MDSLSIVQHYGILDTSSNPERAIPSDLHATDGAGGGARLPYRRKVVASAAS